LLGFEPPSGRGHRASFKVFGQPTGNFNFTRITARSSDCDHPFVHGSLSRRHERRNRHGAVKVTKMRKGEEASQYGQAVDVLPGRLSNPAQEN
jgi:hypothetical protein